MLSQKKQTATVVLQLTYYCLLLPIICVALFCGQFLPRCMECNAVLTMRFLSVCPSVRLSVCLSVCQTRAL